MQIRELGKGKKKKRRGDVLDWRANPRTRIEKASDAMQENLKSCSKKVICSGTVSCRVKKKVKREERGEGLTHQNELRTRNQSKKIQFEVRYVSRD